MDKLTLSDEEIHDFKIEAIELLDAAEAGLLKIENGGDFLENYDAIFRVLHSLKGGASMLGMSELQNHMHKLETLFTECKATGKIEKGGVTLFLKGVDAARKLLNGESIEFSYDICKETPSIAPQPSAPLSASLNVPTAHVHTENRPLIYIVDDEPDLLRLLKDLLQSSGFECVTFPLAFGVIDAVKKKRPDVILCDFSMPGKNGNELLHDLRTIEPDLPFILLSAHLSKNTLIDTINGGVFAVIEKPYNEGAIINTCLNAAKYFQLFNLLNKGINLLLYQFPDLDSHLKEHGKDDIRKTLQNEMSMLMENRRQLRGLKK